MRVVRNLLILLVVLGSILVVADRVGAWVATGVVADQVAAELASNGVESEPPEVTFDRVPFLTQVIGGEYTSVTLRLRNVGSSEIRLPVLELTATGVSASMSTLISQEGPIVADHVTGTATIGYEAVAALTDVEGLELAPGEGDALWIRAPADLFGAQVMVVGTASVTVEEGVENTIRIRPDELNVEDPSELPPGAEPAVEEFAQRLSVDLALPPLPYGLTVNAVRAEQAGLAVDLSANDVPLSS